MLIVAGDLHLGAGASLGRLADQQASWELLCKVAVEQRADVVGTGDWLHHRKPSAQEVDAFQAGLRILREGGREFVTIAGNHEVTTLDAVSCLETACAGYDAVVLRGPDVITMQDDTRVGFLPWTPYTDARQMAENLMITAENLAEQGARILIGHWALAGSALPTGLPVLELAEPILDPHRLGELFDVVLMGHIHKRQVVIGEPHEWPRVLHAGPLCRGNFGEAGIETGAWQLAPISDGLESSFIGASWFDVADRAFVVVEADVTEAGHYAIDQILEQIQDADIAEAVVRVRWSQRADQVIDTAVVLATCMEYGAWKVDRLEPIVERVQSTRSAGVTEASDPREAWTAWRSAQAAVASDEVLAAADEQAHQRIGAAS